MDTFSESYIGQLRSLVGHQLLLLPGARIVIEDSQNRVLLQLRSDFNVWGLPGGNAEPGESLEQVVKREVLEETGLTLNNIDVFGFGNNPKHESHTFPNGDKCQFFVLNFYTFSYHGNLDSDNDESVKLEWFEINKLPKMLPNMQASLVAFQHYKTTGKFQLF